MKLMSLFDGSGGFPLAASLCGIEPVYAAEVEPYPIAVTKNRFQKMKHLGDVSKVKGGEIEPVDIITFGSPCQDMSIAGKRAGLKHADMGDDETTRSGLFLEAIRIIKEMREATNGVYPRYAIWENVPGAFSSNRGEDFRTILEEFIRVKEKDAVMPDVPKAGWPYADCYSGNGWSLAYRVFDAQYWGVPQRRRRIYLVADFRGECAGKILFEREGVRGYFETGKTPWQGIAVDAQNCAGADDRAGEVPYTLKIRSGCEGGGKGAVDSIGGKAETAWHGDTVPCLKATHYKNPPCITVSAGFCPEVSAKTRGVGYAEEQSPTLRAGAVPAVVYDARDNGDGQTVSTITGEHNNRVTDYTCLVVEPAVRCCDSGTGGNNVPGVIYCLQGNGIDRADTAGCNGKGWRENECYTLNTIDRPAVVYCIGNSQLNQNKFSEKAGTLNCMHNQQGVIEVIAIDRAAFNQGKTLSSVLRFLNKVRRLTPIECARLQGFPDLWGYLDKKESFTDEEYKFWLEVRNTYTRINNKAVKDYTKAQMLSWYNKLHSDSAEYKMWGNGIALPNALYVMQGIAEVVGVHHSK